jgi:DNA repair protein RadC
VSGGRSGGRTWWAHVAFTRINITPTILRKKFEELMNVRGIGEKSFLTLKPLITVAVAKADRSTP